MDILEVGEFKIKVEIENVFSNGCSARLKKDKLKLRIPCSMNREERFNQILKFKEWAKKQILKHPEKFRFAVREYKDGDLLRIGDEDYRLHIYFKERNSSHARLSNKDIFLTISSNINAEEQRKHISGLLSRCVASQRISKLREKIDSLNQKHFKKEINGIKFKHQKSIWGSCSNGKNINISTRLLFAPDEILEYVCIHELAHLIEFNHSENFWKLVEDAMPDYREKEKWLSINGKDCNF